MTDEQLMRRAITLSRESVRSGRGGPFGALVVADGRIMAEGSNLVTSTNDPTAHAEVVAIRRACAALGRFDLRGAEIFTSCEPCPMCLAAIYWARLDRVTYANDRCDAARIGFDDAYIYEQLSLAPDARVVPMRRLLGDEALLAFDDWARDPALARY